MCLSTILFLIFLLCNTASGFYSQARRYDELLRLGNPCHPRDTCQSLNETSEDHLWRNRICECGQHCTRHQTCCVDSSYFGTEQFVPNHAEETCQKVQTKDFWVYMVSTCLPEWNKNYVYEKCVYSKNDLKDPLSEVPVTSIASMTTYKNFFCALCNNDAGSAVLWDIEVSPPKNLNLPKRAVPSRDDIIERMEYNPGQNAWGFLYVDPRTRKQQFEKILIKFKLKAELQIYVKPCHPGIISKCSPSYKSTRLHYKCNAYYSPIEGGKRGSPEMLTYRNIHCALCNGLRVNVDDFICLIDEIPRQASPVSFTKLLDVNRNSGNIVGRTAVCKEGQAYDPFFKKCRSLVCAMPNYVITNGACVKSD